MDDLQNVEPFVKVASLKGQEGRIEKNTETSANAVDHSIKCPQFDETGSCREGFRCRFLAAHLSRADDGSVVLTQDFTKKEATLPTTSELNPIKPGLFKALRTRKVRPSQ